MKLMNSSIQPSIGGFSGYKIENWQLDDNFEAHVKIGEKICSFGIRERGKKNITFDIAKLMNIDTAKDKLLQKYEQQEELFLSLGIDCVVLNYKHPERYKEVLEKIEKIVNDYFKSK